LGKDLTDILGDVRISSSAEVEETVSSEEVENLKSLLRALEYQIESLEVKKI